MTDGTKTCKQDITEAVKTTHAKTMFFSQCQKLCQVFGMKPLRTVIEESNSFKSGVYMKHLGGVGFF